jgi:hypothetical protein
LAGSLPVTVQAISLKDHEDSISTLIKFADGSIGTVVYSSVGDSAVGKELIEVFAPSMVVQVDDFRRLTITRNGKVEVQRASQDKGQSAMMAAFLNAVQVGSISPIPLDELVAVTEATFAIEKALRCGGLISFGPED